MQNHQSVERHAGVTDRGGGRETRPLQAAACYAILFLVLVVARVAAAAEGSVDTALLDDLMSAPYADDVVAASQADVIAWVELEKGTRSLWAAWAPDFAAKRLVEYGGDDGQMLRSPSLAPGGDYLYYSRGGAANTEGLHPNPESLARKTEQAVWRVPLTGGEPERIAEGSGPMVNPVTGDLVFRQSGELKIVRAGALAEGDFAAETYFHVRGGARDLSWAPDGRRVVFSSNRGYHGMIGIYDPERPAIRWLDPDVTRDMYPEWSPDGSKVAFLRIPGKRKTDYNDFSAGWTFVVRVYDLEADRGRQVWASPGEGGSRYEWWRATPLLWADDDTLIFNSEHDNWLRSYRLDLATGNAMPLTDSGCEIFGNTGSGQRPYVASTNCSDIDRRHLTAFDADNGSSRPLTDDSGIEIKPVALAGGNHVAFLRATAELPQAVYVVDFESGAMRRVSRLPRSRFTARNLVVPRSVTFESAADDKARIHGQIFNAGNDGDRYKPAVIFLHGGPIRQTVTGWYTVDYYDRFYAMNQYLANSGYVVLSVNYRAGVGYGKEYRTTGGLGPHGALELGDVVGGARYLRELPEVDPERIVVYGGSYGGYLTAMGLAHRSDLFRAGVDVHGVHDWKWAGEYYTWTKGAGWAIVGKEAMEIAYESSPVAAIDTWRSPVLFAHGDDDHNVDIRQTVHLASELRRRDVSVEVLLLPGEGHGILRHQSWRSIFVRAARFFDRYLEPRSRAAAEP